MGFKARTVGGGPARELGQDFVDQLRNFVNTGSFGAVTAGQQFSNANPSRDTGNYYGLLNSIISNPSTDQAVMDRISKEQERNVNSLRARFGASGGNAFGSGAQLAESAYRAEATPQIALALDEMARNRIAALMPFLQAITQLSSLGIPQAQTVMQPSPWAQALNLGLDVANTIANFIPGGGGGDTNSRMSGVGMPTPTAPPPNVAPIGPVQIPEIGNVQPILSRRVVPFDIDYSALYR